MYDAFISYSHAADGKLAPAVEKSLQRFGIPWWKKRVLNIFRDESSLSVSPHLWTNIEEALSKSSYLIYMASPKSAESKWVKKEINYWIENKSLDTLLIALTDGEIIWDESESVFFDSRTNSLPDNLKTKFDEEPFYIDLRAFKNKEELSLKNLLFQKEILKLAAQLHGKAPKDLASEELKAQRRWRIIKNTAILILTGLLVFSIYQTIEAINNKNDAIEQANNARNQTKKSIANSLIATSNYLNQTNPTVSFRLAEYSLMYDSSNIDSYSALLRAFYSNPHYYLGQLHGSSFYDNKSQKMKDIEPPKDLEFYAPDIKVPGSFLKKIGIDYKSEFLFLSRTILSPESNFSLFFYSPEADMAEYTVELWDITGEFTRWGNRIWNDETEDWYDDPLYQQYLTYNQIDGLDETNFSYDNRYLVVPRNNKANIISIPFSGQKYLGRTFDTYSSIPLEFEIGSSSSQLIRANFSTEEHIVSTIDLKGDTVSFNLEKMPLLTIPFGNKTTIYSDIEGEYIISETLNSTTVWNLFGEKLGTGKIDKDVFKPDSAFQKSIKTVNVISILSPEYYNSYGFENDTAAISMDGLIKMNGTIISDSLGKEQLALEGHSEIISSVDVSDLGEYFLTAICPKIGVPETKLWDNKGKELLTIKNFGGKVGFLPKNKAFYTYTIRCCVECDSDPSVVVWPIDKTVLINWVNKNQIHEITDSEKSQFGIETSYLIDN
ncbi:toll/interleukin-1 receptor domain-containing protein [Algoriphagus pacificus]|uniref:TIR domain-containing protein n=1 Tax=Algoriphagus pacificus TaxID=2811234 RepID=A0ABS3CIU5_9BACT|nr:toll/interleukin-1 receptor domain-containing protein [Algoriphagus pacificus]MBN7817024.1 TIR domain-containing protein [Algoriphagus pacificus]